VTAEPSFGPASRGLKGLGYAGRIDSAVRDLAVTFDAGV
jgi:hypothetical protein